MAAEPRFEPGIEHKVEHKAAAEPRFEPGIEHKVEPGIDFKNATN